MEVILFADSQELVRKTSIPVSELIAVGTVARIKRIPIEERVQAAVIAWMRTRPRTMTQ